MLQKNVAVLARDGKAFFVRAVRAAVFRDDDFVTHSQRTELALYRSNRTIDCSSLVISWDYNGNGLHHAHVFFTCTLKSISVKVSVIGIGYVGTVTAACFAKLGHSVVCTARSSEKVAQINRGESPIYEPGLGELLKETAGSGALRATTDNKEAVANTDATFICVGTPCQESGEIDLAAVRGVAAEIGDALKEKGGYHVVVMKSTVVPSTTDSVLIPILEKHSGKKAGSGFGVAMNPEFLREGYAVRDFMEGDRVVIGGIDQRSSETVRALYANLKMPVMLTGLRTAEMIKYASNSFLATKISFINEVANVCERLGIDVYDVAKGMGMDRRISPHFLSAGIGFGGSCFPKDVTALAFLAKRLGYEPLMLDTALRINEAQPYRLVELAETAIGSLHGKCIAVLGLAFKDNTDDMREAPSIRIIDRLLEKGASVVAFDPQAADNARKIWGERIAYAKNALDALDGADACLIVTEWGEFGKIKAGEFKTRMRNAVVIEGRNVLDRAALVKAGVRYLGVGRLPG